MEQCLMSIGCKNVGRTKKIIVGTIAHVFWGMESI